MKTLIFFFVCACLFKLNSAFAQQQNTKVLPEVDINSTALKISPTVLRSFASDFNNPEKIKWFRVSQHFLVKFIQGDQLYNALYRTNGRLIYQVAYGFEKNLPEALRRQVKSKYHNYDITRVFNVKQDNRDIWMVNMENEKTLINTRIEDREMNEVSRIKNSTDKLITTAIIN